MKIIKELLPYAIIILIVVIIRTFIITPVRVDGNSMNSTLKDGEILLLEKFDKNLKRFDIIVLDYNGEKLIKRVIGLPGEKVEYKNNKLYINDKKIDEPFIEEETYDFKLDYIIPKDNYFVVGDNRDNSLDSRIIGVISSDSILGKTIFRIFPFNKFGSLKGL